MYNQSEVKPLGKKRLKVVNPKNNKKYSIEFLIVSGACQSILGLRASEHLQLLTVNKQNIHTVDSDGVKSESHKVEDYMSANWMDNWTTPPGDRQECLASPATYTESANRPQRTSKKRIGRIVEYWSDSKGRYTK